MTVLELRLARSTLTCLWLAAGWLARPGGGRFARLELRCAGRLLEELSRCR